MSYNWPKTGTYFDDALQYVFAYDSLMTRSGLVQICHHFYHLLSKWHIVHSNPISLEHKEKANS